MNKKNLRRVCDAKTVALNAAAEEDEETYRKDLIKAVKILESISEDAHREVYADE